MTCKDDHHDFVPGDVVINDGLGFGNRVPGAICRRCGVAVTGVVERKPGVISVAVAEYIKSKSRKR